MLKPETNQYKLSSFSLEIEPTVDAVTGFIKESDGIIVPAWKYPDGHLFRGGVAGTTPDIGMVEVTVETNGDILVRKHIAELGESLKARVNHI